MKSYKLLIVLVFMACINYAANGQRKDVLLNNGWQTILSDSSGTAPQQSSAAWQQISVPHTWDKYEGYRQLKHGNKHGSAWYLRSVGIGKEYKGKQLFLWFEGVSSFATVWVNNKEAGRHAGGRTSFTIDITSLVKPGVTNTILVKADHPSFIRTLPWVCGGCSEEQGFSEGSQPMGIFRPVHLVATAPVRVEPFGVHIWNDSNVTSKSAILHSATEVKNYAGAGREVAVVTAIMDPTGKLVESYSERQVLKAAQTVILKHTTRVISNPMLWSPEKPLLYSAITQVLYEGKVTDEVTTTFGIRSIRWNLESKTGDGQLLVNGKPFFLNGTAEYEHMMGNSHAFTDMEIKARAMQVRAAGFNAFRDAHQPHNLRYQQYWDSLGVLWWPQFAAHIWFDLPEFRENFKTLLRDWVKERRNSPSIILWGLENESTLPGDFAQECSVIIRELDPTASSQRKITTCNGGTGTDWNVPQNWTGTYGGNPAEYGSDLIKQVLVGEYGAWRSIGWHAEGAFDQKGSLTEDRMTQLMEMKVRLADSVKKRTTGHFHWLLYSHDNPGRVQPDEGYRYIDKIGPVNNKGLFTIWGEPTDAFYMFRANFTSPLTDPMVYIVSHTWPERLVAPGKVNITVYSNCDEVELFNDSQGYHSFGKMKKGATGTHFEWDGVAVEYNLLYARGYVKGQMIAEDQVILNHLPPSPHFKSLFAHASNITQPAAGYNYLYRINCGGPDYKDINGNTWKADLPFTDSAGAGSLSWAAAFPELATAQASQRQSFDLVSNTKDWPLFRQYRYGREQLQYYFPVPDGEYQVELYFTEPWYGIGGGMNCSQWRVFDVAINGRTVIKDLDIWKQSGANTALRKTVKAVIKGGHLTISFPSVQSGQAIISAIAIASPTIKTAGNVTNYGEMKKLTLPAGWSVQQWLDKGDLQFSDSNTRFNTLPPLLYGDTWIRSASQKPDDKIIPSFSLKKTAVVYVAIEKNAPSWLSGFIPDEDSIISDAKGGTVLKLYKKAIPADSLLMFGNTTSQNFNIIIHYPTAFERAAKIKRPVLLYPAEQAVLKNAATASALEGFSGSNYAVARQAFKDTVSWNITVGVGDVYELRFRYRTATEKQVPAWLTVTASDGAVMRRDKIFFTGTTTKWKTLYSSTGTSINAGVYNVSIVLAGNEELYLDKLEVQ